MKAINWALGRRGFDFFNLHKGEKQFQEVKWKQNLKFFSQVQEYVVNCRWGSPFVSSPCSLSIMNLGSWQRLSPCTKGDFDVTFSLQFFFAFMYHICSRKANLAVGISTAKVMLSSLGCRLTQHHFHWWLPTKGPLSPNTVLTVYCILRSLPCCRFS